MSTPADAISTSKLQFQSPSRFRRVAQDWHANIIIRSLAPDLEVFIARAGTKVVHVQPDLLHNHLLLQERTAATVGASGFFHHFHPANVH